MSTLKDIDHDRAITITPTVRTLIDDHAFVDFAKQLDNPNLLQCDTPLAKQSITLTGDHSRRFLEWLASGPWGAMLEKDLQSISETEKGEPLLTTWLDLDRFEQLANDAHAADVLSLQSNFATWRSLETRNVYLVGFNLKG